MILVTGGTGLVGSHLLFDLVKKGEPVRALLRKNSNTDSIRKIFSYYSDRADELFSKIEWKEGNLLDIFSLSEAMEEITQVYHCAALVSLSPKDGNKMIHNNVIGTANMVNVALEKKIQKFCHVSSVAALGIETGKETSEETHWNEKTNFSAYAISKYLSENEIWRASQEGLPVVIVNPSVIIGPGNWKRSSGDIFNVANKGINWYPNGKVGYVDVRDVAKAMQLLMKSEIRNERFVVSSENMSYKEFIRLVCAGLGKPLPNKKAGKWMLESAWRAAKIRNILTGKRSPITKEIAKYASMNLAYSNKKIKDTLQFNFIPISKSVADTSNHFLSDKNAILK